MPVIVCQGALRRVAEHSGDERQHPYPYAPNGVHIAGHGLPRHAATEGEVYAEKPDVACKPVDDAPHKGFLPRQPGQLSVGRVAEVGQHQQQHSERVVRQVGVIEHPCSRHSEHDRHRRDGVRVYAETLACQCHNQPYGPVEEHVKPLFRVFRLD